MNYIFKYALLTAIGAICYHNQFDAFYSFVFVVGLWACLGGYYTLYLVYHTLPRDLV